MSRRKLRLIMFIDMFGFMKGQPIIVYFTRKKKYSESGLYPITRGEGQALQFVLEDYDLSTAFNEAMKDGRFDEFVMNNAAGHFEMRWVSHEKDTNA